MPLVDVDNLALTGLIRDVEPHLIMPEAWTTASEIRFRDGGAEMRTGREQVFGTPGVAPYFAMSVTSSAQTWWLYTSLLKAYVYDGTTHTDITRAAGGDYSASQARDWNGTLLGGTPILNNGVDDPQYWASYSAGTKLAVLPNWDTNVKALVIRAFGPYLLALNVTDTGTSLPHAVRWSHPADPGSVPSSWDVTDATKDAGQSELPDVQAGLIRDGLPLRGNFYVYKDGSTWRVTFIGGTYIFDFKVFLETSGILSQRCVAMTADGARHVVASQDDIIMHDGNSVKSILDKRMRRALFNAIDDTNYANSFVFSNPQSSEIWFCYPEQGQTHPSRALVWAYKEGEIGALSEASVNFQNAAIGTIENPSTGTWNSDSNTWDSDTDPWGIALRRKVVLCDPVNTKFYQMDSGTTDDGSTITATLQRLGLSIVGKDRTGQAIVNHQQRKFVTRVWISARGGPFDVRVGYQNTVEGSVAWSNKVSFDPSTQKWVDVAISGVAIALEFSGTTWFRVSAYKLELDVIGEY